MTAAIEPAPSVFTLLSRAIRELGCAGVASPRFDATELLAHAAGTTRAQLITCTSVDPAVRPRFLHLVAQRAARVPLQHLTGVAGFRHLELAVGGGVFVPRPETEVLLDWAVPWLARIGRPVVVDLCAGSGALALAIADETRGADVHAVELDPRALAWARRNAEATGLDVTLHLADAADCLPDLAGRVDLVLSNPPYIPVGARVGPEVARHDPPLALWGGADGLNVVRRVAVSAARLLRPGGAVCIEHASLQGESVPALLSGMAGRRTLAGGAVIWEDVTDHPDLLHLPRFTTASRSRAAAPPDTIPPREKGTDEPPV